ncbi:MAG: META domain-containing protein [Ardenticatenaceae bacterium]|nr:META domain-containing protein [Ardenticatenaceae bacterium]MCB9005685.1 META domain-containing protein [Ardenticatenaceae bacterium]
MIMNTKITYLLILLVAGLLLIGCTSSEEPTAVGDEPTPPVVDEEPVGLANPASVHCEEQGGTLEMHSDADGGQYGVCLFDDGSECEEWAYFRGECAPGDTQLFETLWVLQSYGGQTPVADTTPTLTISKDWQLGGSTGCNSFFGSVTRDGDAWQVGPMGMTEMACMDGGVMEQETAVINLIQSVTSHTLAAGSLTLHAPGGDLVYAPAKNAALEGTQWTLSSIAQNDAVVSNSIDADITMQLADGTVSGSTGCNEFFGSYTVDGQTLSLSALGLTRRACDEAHGKREQELMAAFEQVTSYRTQLDALTLLDAAGNVVMSWTVVEP